MRDLLSSRSPFFAIPGILAEEILGRPGRRLRLGADLFGRRILAVVCILFPFFTTIANAAPRPLALAFGKCNRKNADKQMNDRRAIDLTAQKPECKALRCQDPILNDLGRNLGA